MTLFVFSFIAVQTVTNSSTAVSLQGYSKEAGLEWFPLDPELNSSVNFGPLHACISASI